jgi:V/A-type H+-transporting ATPase subunit F
MKILVIGNSEAVDGFSLVGVDGRSAATVSEVNQALDEALSMPDVGIVLVTTDVAKLVESRMDKLKLQATVPLVVEIPGPVGQAAEEPSLSDVIRRAIGIKI